MNVDPTKDFMDKEQPKLYLNMILGENEPVEMVKRGIDSIRDYIDGIYVTVTYNKTQPTSSALIDLLHQYKAEVSYCKWIDDFAAARNFALNQVPKADNNYIIWIDADDILQGGDKLRDVLWDMHGRGWAGVFFVYLYRVRLDKEGNVDEVFIEQQRERVIRNDGTYKWVGELHETLIGQKTENLQQYLRPECTVIHLTDGERVDRALGRNIRILEAKAIKEKHQDPRTLVYLAKSYYDQGMEILKASKDDSQDKIIHEWFDKALLLFDEYLQGKGEVGSKDYIEQSGWPEERASGWQFVSEIYIQKGEFLKALDAINQAIDEAPKFPQYYVDKAVIYTHLNDFDKSKHWLTVGTNIAMPKTTLMSSPHDLKVRVLECDAHIALNENDLRRMADDYKRLLIIDPDNEMYKNQQVIATSLEGANKAATSIVYLGKYLTKIGEEDKITALLQAVPKDLQREPFYSQMRNTHIPPRMWEDDEIAIICGPGFEQWSPKSIDTGLGGSEEAIVYLSQELKKLGWKITVYANPEDDEGDYDGVRYENYYKLNPDDFFNHLIVWRGIGFTDIKARARGKRILWMHDMPNVPDFTPERLAEVDKIAVLSQFHREQVKVFDKGEINNIPDDKFFLTSNGIPDLGITTWKGNPHRVCYVSSPDRGLIYLLKNWSVVKKAVPDAELHIYYGFNVYDFVHRNNPAKIAFKKKIMDMMKQDGITYHARVGHKELAVEMNKCGIWSYPTDFTEINCISAAKAQALGSVPCVTNFAALKEVVKNGLKIDVDIQDRKGQKIYFETLIDLLKHPKKQEDLRNMAWAQDYFSWKRVAIKWNDLLRGSITTTSEIKTPLEWAKELQDKKGGDKNGRKKNSK